ncbi:MAG TPA: hypothetical protein VLL48_00245, partial [Longimicrobiales bacterium]|nr:hypothetical protein [Longimicrobiales bacterium]
VQAEPPAAWSRVIRGPGIEVHHAREDSSRARAILEFLAGQPPLPALPPGLPDSVRVYLAPSEEIFDSLTGGRIPEWGTGVAVPRARAIVLPAYGGERGRGWSQGRVLRHEWAHLGLHQRLEGLRVPRWFDEGYAEWASGGWNAGEGWRLRLALATGGGPDLDSLSLGWPRERVRAEVAYMLAGSAVEYLARGSGERGFELLFRRWTELGSFDAALRRVYGVTPAQLEEDWREYVKSRYGWLFVLSHSVVFWLFLALVLLGMVWIRRRRNRRAMARLRATEPADTPAWWEGPSPEERG